MNTPDTNSQAEGAVNFDSGTIPNSELRQIEQVESKPADEPTTLGNVRTIGAVSSDAPAAVHVAPVKTRVHTIMLDLNLTIGTGLPFLAGTKELRSVEIERGDQVRKFNFYNPFVRADKERATGEGLLRTTFGAIASLAHKILGREAVYVGTDSDIEACIAALAKTATDKLKAQLPLRADDVIFSVPLDVDGTEISRPVTFNELFSLSSWTTEEVDDTECVITHTVHFNIGMNIGAVYDSSEPHVFVRKTKSFMESQLSALGLEDVIDYHVNYAFDSSSLGEASVRDLLEILIGEDGYTVVSAAGVAAGQYDWAKSVKLDQLFGFGCDLMVRSAQPVAEEEAAEGAD